MHSRKKIEKGGPSGGGGDMEEEPNMNIKNIMKDIEFLASSHMTWKERKQIENKKFVALGSKSRKKQKLPLSVARPIMKKQKEREQKLQEERLILGQFQGKRGGSGRPSSTRKEEGGGILKSTQGHFRNGVLNVKNLLRPPPSRDGGDFSNHAFEKGRKKGGKKKNAGKKKGGGKKRH